MGEKIGLAIITKQPRDTFPDAFDFWHHMVDHVVVVNDGDEFTYDWDSNFRNLYVSRFPETTLTYIKNPENLGVAASKNKGMRHLLDQGCDHIFIMEDDMRIKDNGIFRAYINASKKSGIQHFNFSQHGFANKIRDDAGNIIPNPKITVKYGDIGISFYQHCVGSFSYYSKKCLDDVGLMDERYYNACEHVDHTYEIIKKGYHPPFWWFADIENSWEYIGDDGWSMETSSICSSPDFVENVKNSDDVFVKKHGHLPVQTPSTEMSEFAKSLKEIKKKWTI